MGNNASHAVRVAYGGIPISVHVKRHKKKVKLKTFLDRIDRIWDQFLVKEIRQIEREVDAYLRRLRRRTPRGYDHNQGLIIPTPSSLW
jgi:hypothetical protein